jgi:hypothetical protein
MRGDVVLANALGVASLLMVWVAASVFKRK